MKLWDRLKNEVMLHVYEAEGKIQDARVERMKPLKPGIVIRESRGGYDHYGIYVGEGNVIHFTDGQVRETNLYTFCRMQGKKLQIMSFDSHLIKGVSLQASARRARKQLGKSRYDLLKNNCEHFALWCRTGKAFSSQALGSTSNHYPLPGSAAGSITGDATKFIAKDFGMSVSRIFQADECYDEEA